jgi:uncharacterized membrane protein
MKTNQDYKNAALAALKGNWAPAILATVIFMIILVICILPNQIATLRLQGIASDPDIADNLGALLKILGMFYAVSALTLFMYFFVYFPLTVGFYNAFRRLLVNGENDLTTNMFQITLNGYWRKMLGMLLMYVLTMLWSLLFIIPGIVKGFAYAMTPYILEEHPEMTANSAIDRSVAMMKGHKFDLFYLYLSFIGWYILGILTLGIGYLWLAPYVQTSVAAFYEDVKAEYEAVSMD